MSDILLKTLKDNNPDDVLFLENAFFKDETHISASLVARRKDILELVYIYMDQLLREYQFDKQYHLVADNTVDSIALLIAMVTLNLHPIIIPANILKNSEKYEESYSSVEKILPLAYYMPIHNTTILAGNEKISSKNNSIFNQLLNLGVEYLKYKKDSNADLYIISSGSISGHSAPYPINIYDFIQNSIDSKLFEKRVMNSQFQISYTDISCLSGFLYELFGPLFNNVPVNLIDYKNSSCMISVEDGAKAMKTTYNLDALDAFTLDYRTLDGKIDEYFREKSNTCAENFNYSLYCINNLSCLFKYITDFDIKILNFLEENKYSIKNIQKVKDAIPFLVSRKSFFSPEFDKIPLKYQSPFNEEELYQMIDDMIDKINYMFVMSSNSDSKVYRRERNRRKEQHKRALSYSSKEDKYLKFDTIDEYPDKIGFAFMNFFSKEEEDDFRYGQFYNAFGSSLMLPVDFFYTLSDDDDLSNCNYKYLLTAGSPLSSFKCKQVKKTLGSNNETKLLNTFGMTQSNGVITCFDAAETPDIYFSLLYLMNGKIKEVEKDSLFAIKLIPIAKSTDYNENKLRTTSNLVGELIINGEHTGDLSFEHNGYIYFVSRMHDIIKANNKLNVALLEQYFQELVNNYVIVQRIYKEDNDSIEIVLIDNEIDDIEEKKQIIDNFMHRYFNDIEYKVVISTINDIRMSNNLGKSIKDGSSLLR